MSVTTETPASAAPKKAGEPRRVGGGLLDPKILWKSLPDAFKKLDPRVQLLERIRQGPPQHLRVE